MTTPMAGLIAGILLALCAVVGGLLGLLLAIVLGALGYVVAGQLSGDLDLGHLLGRDRS